MPAKAGIQQAVEIFWIPAYAGNDEITGRSELP
jgi:hypothetical protein